MSTPTPPTLRLSISTWCRFAAGWVNPFGEPQLCCQNYEPKPSCSAQSIVFELA